MARKNRAILKNYFLKGSIPKESQFHDLIDSAINQDDDGIQKEEDQSFKIKAEGPNEELLRFYKNIEDLQPTWSFSQKANDGNEGFNIVETGSESRLFIETGGNVGVGITQPRAKLDVDGFIGMAGRIGFYVQGEVPADGQWHDIITGLNDYNAFEVVCVTGRKGAHAITHAIAVSAYGNSRGSINKTMGYYGQSRNRIDLRWEGSYFDYQLQVRTKRTLGDGVFIDFNVAKLF